MRFVTLSGAAAFACLPAFAIAQEGPITIFSEGVLEIQNDYNFDSDDPAAELNDTFVYFESVVGIRFNNTGSAFQATTVFEPIRDPVDDRFFEDHGYYFEELFFSQEFRGTEFVLGKFNPEFGFAWDVAPGIYGVDFAEDYELTERLGVAVNAPVFNGDHNLQLAVFQADRTRFSDSVFANRGQVRFSDGGVSNTRGPHSLSGSLSGEFGTTAYNVGLQHQAKGSGDLKDQNGVVAGVLHNFQQAEVLAELAFFHGFEGTRNDAVYFTTGVAVPVGRANLSGVFSLRDIDGNPTDRLFTVTGEFAITDNVSAGVAYRFGDEGGVDTQTFGTILVVEF